VTKQEFMLSISKVFQEGVTDLNSDKAYLSLVRLVDEFEAAVREATIEDYLNHQVGPRCTEYNEDCIVCITWESYDEYKAKLRAKPEGSK
jgi:hypothetical protein